MHNAASGCLQQPSSDTPTAQFLAPGRKIVKGHSSCWHSPCILYLTPQRTFILFTNSKCFNVRHIKKLWKNYVNSSQWKNNQKSTSPSGKNAAILRLRKIFSNEYHISLFKQQRTRNTSIALKLFLQSFSSNLRHRNWRVHFLKREVNLAFYLSFSTLQKNY